MSTAGFGSGRIPTRTSNTSMKLNSCRLTSSKGGAVSAAYTAIISAARVAGGCNAIIDGRRRWRAVDKWLWCFISCILML